VPIAGQPAHYKAEGAITLAHSHSALTFSIKDGSDKTTQWQAAVIRSNETLSVDIKMSAPNPAPYTHDDTPYVKERFTLQLTGTYNGDEAQNLELHINKDGAKLAGQDLTSLGVTIQKNGTLVNGVQLCDNTISGFKSGTKTNESEIYTVTFTPRADHKDDGRYVFTFRSAAGDVQKQQSLWVDTKAPELTPRVPADGQPLKDQPNLFAVVADTPGAGIKTVTAKLNSNETIALKPIKGNSVESNGALALREGQNTITFDYSDLLGNAASKTITFHYDKTPPELSDIKMDGKESDTILIGTQSNNEMKSFTIAGKVKDSINMDAVYATITNKKTGNSVGLMKKPVAGNTEQSFSWTVDHSMLAGIASTEGVYTISIRAEDKAGLTTTVVRTFEVDKDKPEVTVKTPAAGSTVNKTIVISGTASDKQKLKSVQVVKKDSPTTELEGVTESNGDASNKAVFTGDKAASWSFKLDTTKYVPISTGNSGTGSIVLKVIAEDEVGNRTEQEHTITVNQNDDRPVITITSFEHIASAKLSSSKILTGTISDDDGLLNDLAHDLEIKIGSGEYKPVTFGSGGSFWTYNLETLADGDHTINFKVKDAAGTIFCKENAGTKFVCPNTIGKSDALSTGKDKDISFKLDNTPPQIKSDDVRFVLGTSLAALNETSEDSKIIANRKVGNTSNRKASFRVFAKDSSGINDVGLSFSDGAETPLTRNTAKNKNGWEAWEVEGVDLTEGTHVLKIKVTDTSGFPNYWQQTVVCDFTAPAIIMQNPLQESNDWARELLVGKTVISGSFADTASGMKAGSAVCKIGTNRDALRSGDTFTVSSSGLSWTLELTDASEYGTTQYSTNRFKPNFTSDSNGKIYKVPLYLAVEDGAGNKAEKTFYLTIDSDGKTPKVSIFGPEQLPPAQGESGADVHNGLKKVTLGGTVRFYGDAAVNKPTSGAKVVSLEARFSPSADFAASFIKEVSLGLPNAGETKDWKNGVPVVEKSSGITSWDFSIDSTKFLVGSSGGSIDLYYSIRAKNDEGTYCDWTPARKIKLDQNAPIFKEAKIEKGSEQQDYVSGKFVTDGYYLTVDLISTTGISSISVEVANAGSEYNGLKNLTNDTAIAAARVASEQVFTPYPLTDGKSGYTMKLPLKTKTMTDPDQNCKITINLTGGQSNGAIPNFNQFNLKYDNTKPAVAFGIPEGEGGLAQFTTSGATGVAAAANNMNTDNLYVFVATKDGSAKEIKVTAVGDKTLTYDSQAADTFADKSEYILFRKNPIIFNNPDKYQLAGIVYDTGSGVAGIVPSIENASLGASVKISKFTSLQGQFSSFKEGFATNTITDGKKALTLQVTDKAGNTGSEYKTDVFLRNKPLKLKTVTFKTDLNGNNDYADDPAKGLVELVSESGHDSHVDTEKKNYSQKIDIKNRFTFKNAGKSQIAFDLDGGEGTTRTFELYKADASGAATETPLKSGNFTASGSMHVIDFTADDFADTKIPQGENQTFVIIVKDGASTTDTDRKLMLTVTLNIKTDDKSKPQVVVLPFFWNAEGDNSLSGNSRENGHIEITKVSSGSGTSDVSGKVVLRGTAYHPTKLTKLELTGAGATVSASYTGGAWSNPTGFTVTDTAFDVHGHWVRWEYTWTTGSPELNKTLTMKAYHNNVESLTSAGSAAQKTAARPTTQSLTLAAGDTAVVGQFLRLYKDEESYLVTISTVKDSLVEWKGTLVPTTITGYTLYSIEYEGNDSNGKTPKYSNGSLAVNVVPYISRISTKLSRGSSLYPSTIDRTALGAYPISRVKKSTDWENESIIVEGFNIEPSTDNVFVLSDKPRCVATGGAALESNVSSITHDKVSSTDGKHTVQLSTLTKSSYFSYVAKKDSVYIPAVNNINVNTKVMNQEANNRNNNLLNDDRYLRLLDVYRVQGLGEVRQLSFAICQNKLNFSAGYMDNKFSIFQNVTDTSAAAHNLRSSYTRYFDNCIAYNENGTPFTLSACGDTLNVPVTDFSKGPSKLALIKGIAPEQSEYSASNTTTLFLESNYNGSALNNLNRFQWPDMAVRGTDSGTKGYISYYDSTQKLIKFRYFESGAVSTGYTSNNHFGITTLFPSGGATNSSDQAVPKYTANGKDYHQGFVAIAGVTANSPYSAVGVTADGTAVVVWYDAVSGSLKMKYNTTPAQSFSGYQAFNALPSEGNISFNLAVDGKTAKQVTFTAKQVSGFGDFPYEFAYQLNKELTEKDFGAYAEYDPILQKPVVRSMQTGTDSSISITGLSSGTVAAAVPGTGTVWVEKTIDKNQAGKNPSITVDSKSGLHIAYNATGDGDLRYAYIPSVTGDNIYISTVDSYQQTGAFTDIAVKEVTENGTAYIVPYISYFTMSLADTRYSVKLAVLKDRLIPKTGTHTFTNDSHGAKGELFTGKWEVMHIPSSQIPVQYRVNVEVAQNGSVYVAYQGDEIEYVKIE
ncbi:MAG: Ig-like domain-containing protein, partial [Treponema sp.]